MSKELVSRPREPVSLFGVMDELATNGASVYKSAETQEFLTRFNIRHRVASAYNPHSNQLVEGAIKAAKRMLRDNTGPRERSTTTSTSPPSWHTETSRTLRRPC